MPCFFGRNNNYSLFERFSWKFDVWLLTSLIKMFCGRLELLESLLFSELSLVVWDYLHKTGVIFINAFYFLLLYIVLVVCCLNGFIEGKLHDFFSDRKYLLIFSRILTWLGPNFLSYYWRPDQLSTEVNGWDYIFKFLLFLAGRTITLIDEGSLRYIDSSYEWCFINLGYLD